MRRILLTALMTMAWLLASPSLQLPDAGWLEVGAPPATAEEFRGIMVAEPAKANKAKKTSQKKAASESQKAKRVGSGGLVTSNQPGLRPIQPIESPRIIAPAGPRTVVIPARDPRYPNVPTVPVVPRGSTAGAGIETSQDRIARCTHQGSLGGLNAGQQGTYIHNCSF